MGKYINTRQLAFLIFVIVALWLGRLYRSEVSQEGTRLIQVPGTLQDEVRTLPYRVTTYANCRQDCLGVSDSSISLLIMYGRIDRSADSILVTGNDLLGNPLTLVCLIEDDTLRVQNLYQIRGDKVCDCATRELQEETPQPLQ